ncbi:Leukotriene-B(4) omega-hydroxylase 2 [Termitomyces sp. T112]|nr:Leukotriene-B(4) omega-hydroxylase 2 [Termitomyces sp. T112]
MAPTIQNGVEQSASSDSKDAQYQTPSAASSQRAYDLHRLRSISKLLRHQNRAETALKVADTIQSSEPYKSPIPLHAKIVPHARPTSQLDTFGHLSVTELILISLAALMAFMVGVVALVMMRSIIIKKVRRLLHCGCGRRQTKKPVVDDKGALVMGDEYDDPTWGTPPRLVYVEGLDERFKERHSTSPNDPPSSSLAVISLAPSTPTSPRLSAAREDDSFQGRLEYEEHDITLALTRALRDATDDPDFSATSVHSMASGDERFSALGYLKNSSILDSLQASIDNLANGILPSDRPRQYSDAPTSLRTTTAADSIDCFPVYSSDHSMTSLHSINSSLDDGPEEEVYEVRCAHAQSIDLKKGVLVTCRRTSSTCNIANSGALPTFVISEAPPNLMPLDDLNFAPLFSLNNSMPSKASLSGCTTTPSWSSIVRENSRGTMASLSSSSSTTAMDGWIRDDEQHLHPLVPFLMLTRPSDSSIYTAESYRSSISIDLCDFPLPPISAKPSYYSKLVDQFQRAPKRIWDNHSADSSVAQKRSTVERFIKMYSSIKTWPCITCTHFEVAWVVLLFSSGISCYNGLEASTQLIRESLMSLAFILNSLLASVIFLLFRFVYENFVKVRWSPLHQIAGPPVSGWFKNHLYAVLEPSVSPKVYEMFIKRYGRSIRIRGVGPWDERLLTLDPVSVAHVLKNSTIYEKPWQSRRLITSLIGCGMLSAEGQVHKRQRRVATPAFSVQNLRALVPIVFRKGEELKERWSNMIALTSNDHEKTSEETLRIDVCHWISRATFDVIGAAGFGYEFNAIKDETNELFCAYKEMFEVAISQGNASRTLFNIYFPSISRLFPDKIMRTVERSQKTIHRVASQLIQENKRKLQEAEKSGSSFLGKDLLSLLMKSNASTDLPPEHRISDEDILHNINTFMFAGSDTTSLSVTWTLLMLARHPETQTRLREELLSVACFSTGDLTSLTEDEIHSLYDNIANLSFLNNVCRESLRLVPPVHSSIRVATQDDVVPTSYPVCRRDGTIDEGRRSVTVPKGSFVHVAVEGFNLDKGIWGDDAWEFHPDRWDNLPETAVQQPGLYSNILSFSAGPRSCIGMRFSLIEFKTFLYILITSFVFKVTDEKIFKANVVVTRPYVSGKYKEGSQCPLLVSHYIPTE